MSKPQEVKIITTEKQLQEFTGLSHEELGDNDFDLDDWDICFVSDEPLRTSWLTLQMRDYCCGYRITKYNDNYYHMVYHA